MAQLKITSKLEGLSPAEAADYAARYPYEDDGEQLDAAPYAPGGAILNRRTVITPDDKVWSVGGTRTAWNDERTAPIVQSWQKRHAIETRKAREGWKGDVRAKRDGSDGPEYDRLILSLSKAEAAELGPEGVEKTFRDFIDAARTSPYGGKRLIEVEPVHTDTDHLHLHVSVHRHGYDTAARTISRTVWMPELHGKEAERIAAALPDALTLEYIAPGAAGSRASDEARQAAADMIREAGGAPSPDLTGEGRHAVRQVLPSPEAERIMEAMREVERRMAMRQQEQQEDAALLARIQHAASAVTELERVKVEAAAYAEAAEAAGARAFALEAELGEARTELAQTATRAETAEGIAAERGVTIEEELKPALVELTRERDELAATVESEPDRITEAVTAAVQPVTAERDELAGKVVELTAHAEAEPERQAVAVAAAVDPLVAERDALAARVEAADVARDVAVAELAEERRTLPEKLEAAARQAVEAARGEWEGRVADPLRAEVQALRTEVADLRNQLREAMQTMAEYLRNAAARPLEAVANVAGNVAQAAAGTATRATEKAATVRGAAKVPEWAQKPPSEWNEVDTRAAARHLESARKAGRGGATTETSVEEWGQLAHAQYLRLQQPQQEAAQAPDQPTAPEAPEADEGAPDTGLKPR